MAGRVAAAVLAALLPGLAGAAPSWKSVPGAKPAEGEEGLGAGAEAGLPLNELVRTGLQMLADYYPYLGVVFVLLVLYLFVKGPSKKGAARSARGRRDEVFFEDERDHVIPYR